MIKIGSVIRIAFLEHLCAVHPYSSVTMGQCTTIEKTEGTTNIVEFIPASRFQTRSVSLD